MKATSGMVAGILVVFATVAANAAGGVSGKWLGQDGHDLAGGPASGPNEVQDIHVALTNLPPGKEIIYLRVTGFGADEWLNDGKYKGPYKAEIVRTLRSRTADVYFEPLRVEKGRPFHLSIKFDDGATAEFDVRGRQANPNLRMAGASFAAKWVGQRTQDWVGPGTGVGPDGFQDVELQLTKLSRNAKVISVAVEGPSRLRWQSGINPKGDANAELVRDEKDTTRASLFFQPDRDMTDQSLAVVVAYEGGKSDRTTLKAGRVDPKLRIPGIALPKTKAGTFKVEWLGQDGSRVVGAGDVHLRVSGLGAGRRFAAAVLTDSVRGNWVYHRDERIKTPSAEPDPLPMACQPASDADGADLYFAPIRDETGATLTLRLVLSDGTSSWVQFPGGACNPDLRAPVPSATSVVAKPGDDLNDLVNRYGTVTLSKGTYPLARPLVLNQPVNLTGEVGAELQFAQPAGEPPWTAAIKIHAGGTKLHGFAVRFAGPVRWNREVSWGPAIIGLTDNLDGRPQDPKIGLTFTSLDVESPPSANTGVWEEAPRLMRLVGAAGGGTIAKNVFRGGSIEFFGGPWKIVDNDYRGTPPGTVSTAFVGAHNPHDLLVKGNKAESVGPSGKTWRFVLLTGQGSADRVEDNRVIGIGPRDDDTIPPANMPEVILTESYHMYFEGAPGALSADRRVVGVVRTHGAPVRTGDVVSILAGPHAGQWRRVAQAITPTAFLLDSPLPERVEAIAITPAFVGDVFERNYVDSRGGKKAANLVLAGNHFGTRVLNNKLLGAGEAFQAMAYPTESPNIWGWSHVPFLGGVIEGNEIEDSERGAIVGVMRNEYSKSSRGRVTVSVSLRKNTVRWTDGFLTARERRGEKGAPPGMTIGYAGSLDPGEQVIDAAENRLEAPQKMQSAGGLRIENGRYNGQEIVGKSFRLPASEVAVGAK